MLRAPQMYSICEHFLSYLYSYELSTKMFEVSKLSKVSISALSEHECVCGGLIHSSHIFSFVPV